LVLILAPLNVLGPHRMMSSLPAPANVRQSSSKFAQMPWLLSGVCGMMFDM